MNDTDYAQKEKEYKANIERYKQHLIRSQKALKVNLKRWFDYKQCKNLIDTNSLEDEITELLIEILPHGSGIDYDWDIHFCENKVIECYNYFHYMDSYGGYKGVTPIKVRIFQHKNTITNKLKGIFTGKVQIIAKKGDIDYSLRCNNTGYYTYGLRDSLDYTFNSRLEPYITNNNYTTIDEEVKC